MATGRPTLLGWGGHERQWRGGQPEVEAKLEERFEDAKRIYTTLDDEEARELLAKHGVDYVYVGPTERQFIAEQGAPPEALAKFDRFMELAWSGEDASIYRNTR